MLFQTSTEFGALAGLGRGRVDAVILTGGLAHDDLLIEQIKGRVAFVAPVAVYPGEDEMQALALAGLRALSRSEHIRTYPGPD